MTSSSASVAPLPQCAGSSSSAPNDWAERMTAAVSSASSVCVLALVAEGCNLGVRLRGEELEVAEDDVVIDLHDLAEHDERLFAEADVVVGALRHLLADEIAVPSIFASVLRGAAS